MTPPIDWRRRAEAAERTVAVLKTKVRALYDVGARTALHGQLERARRREEQAHQRRALLEAERAQLAAHNEVLEAKVAERTRALRLVLDHVASGFLVVGPDLRVMPGFSEACHALLGRTVCAGDALTDLLRIEDDAALGLELAFEQVFDDLMPDDVTLAQIPRRFVLDGRVLRLTGRAIRHDGQLTAVLITLQDATALEAAQAESRRHRTLVAILNQRDAFERFLADARHGLDQARQAADEVTARRALHTVKGNAASFDLHEVVTLCHQAESGDSIDLGAIDRVEAALRDFVATHHDVLGMSYATAKGEPPLTITPDAISRLHTIAAQDGMADLRQWIVEVVQHPIEALLGPLPRFAQRLGVRLGKPVQFHLEGGEVPVVRERVQPIVSALPHLVHNAVDHGIEPGGAREGKPALGQLWLTVTDLPTAWRLRMRDDGCGIDTQRLMRRAVASGLLDAQRTGSLSRSEQLDLVFVDGLSSTEQASEISGRGVGMSAVRGAVAAVGGRIELTSVPGQGTTVDILIPKPPSLRPLLTPRAPRRTQCASC